jgi:DNA polymerase-3 subunit gamma/tau
LILVFRKNNSSEEKSGFNEPATSTQQPVTSNKLSPLGKIRKQYQASGDNGNGNTNHPLQDDSLQKAWNDYVQKLKRQKTPAALSFEMALLRIKDDNSFEAVTTDNIQKQFIEQDRKQTL